MKSRKGFTLVELLVVIAILAILATASIIGFTAFTKKAQVSNDSELVTQLNKYAQAASVSKDFKTVTEMRDELIESGFELANLKLEAEKQDYVIGFDIAKDRFVLLKKGEAAEGYTVDKEEDVFAFVKNEQEAKFYEDKGYSLYLQMGYDEPTLTIKTGVDVGENTHITSISYDRHLVTNPDDHQEVVIRTNGDQTSLNVYAPADTVNFYGFAKAIYVADVAPDSLHVFGSVSALAIKEGHVDIENTGIVFDIVQFGDKSSAPGNSGTISNKGYIAETSYSRHTTAPTEQQIEAAQALINNNPESTKNVGGDYEIASLEQLEAFRDAVNSGHTFEGLTAKLTANITLRNGWVPIGEGNRSSYATNKNYDSLYTGTAFRGEFNGNNKTIDNLNNIGFTPTSNRISGDKEYVYGLFALTATGANIHDLTLTNVDIDGTRYNINGVVADSVGALVGASMGGISVNNVTVEGSVKANDAVGGIIGRCYNKDGIELYDNNSQRIAKEVSLTNCSNKASVIGNNEAGCKTAGCFGYISDNSIGYFKITVTGNKNYGIVTGHESYISSIAVLDQAFFTHEGTTITGTNAGKAGRSYTVNTNKAGTNDSNLVDCNTLTFNEWSGGPSVVVIK